MPRVDLCAGEMGSDRVQRVRRALGDRDGVSRPGERSRAEQDQVVGACPEDDVGRLDARVLGDRVEQGGVAAVRVCVHLRERGCDRPWTRGRWGLCRNVAVEAHDLDRIELDTSGELLGRRRPAVVRELLGERSHLCTAAACAGIPSTAASASTVGRSDASPSAVRCCSVTGFRNVSRPRPPTARAQPPVGRTWFPPVA